MDREVVLATVQDRVADCPMVKEEGLEIKDDIMGAGGGGRARVVKVKSGEEVLLFKLSILVTLKW